ncbi:hypothetical protein RGQ21_67780 [Kitasatospora aureofaciens]|nr:hypothetical protein RGQ21_67780 [Kitasatospora aureofaciens]
MSARGELFRRVAGSFVDEDKANKLIDDLLHEEAEKIRAAEPYIPEGFTIRSEWMDVWKSARSELADKIDPYVTE